jgi:hypothetical protein
MFCKFLSRRGLNRAHSLTQHIHHNEGPARDMSQRGMLFHTQVPFSDFSVFIGNASDLCHRSHLGL